MRAAAGESLGALFRIESFRVITDWRARMRRRLARPPVVVAR